jgi:hypothetical protein
MISTGWRVVDFDKTQATRAQLEGLDHQRHQDRERKARERRRKRGLPEPEPPSGEEDVSSVTSGVTSGVTQRQGQEGQEGQAREREPSGSEFPEGTGSPVVAAAPPARPSSDPQADRMPRCSVCSRVMTSPLAIAEGICAGCENSNRERQAS